MSSGAGKDEIRELTESIARELAVMVTESPWATRFVWAAILHGALAAVLTAFAILGTLGLFQPSPVDVIVSSSVGILLISGYLSYLLVGIVGMAVTALFYQYLEVNLKAPYESADRNIAWGHLILSNIGVIGATWLTIFGAYAAAVGSSVVNQRSTFAQFEFPIVLFIAIFLIGTLLGGLGYIRVYGKRRKKTS